MQTDSKDNTLQIFCPFHHRLYSHHNIHSEMLDYRSRVLVLLESIESARCHAPWHGAEIKPIAFHLESHMLRISVDQNIYGNPGIFLC